MIRRLIFAAACLAYFTLAGPPLTTIQDVLYKADGTRFNGTLVIAWSTFQASDSSVIATQTTTVKVVNGNLHVQLVPTGGSSPPIVYSVTYNSDGRVQFHESWSVPSSNQPVRLSEVRLPPSTVGSDTGSGTGGSVEEADIVGLVADLGARPTKAPGYAPGRAAVINENGSLEAASGSPGDCVHVDGSSGPCGSGQTAPAAAFVDTEPLTGIVDGANAQFTLSATPVPVSSLKLYRNGILQQAGSDYTLSGNTVTFVAGATPQPGDLLLAGYRLSDGTLSFADGETPGGAVNGVNTQFTLAGLASPASSLALYRNGILQKAGQDYTLNGQLVTFAAGAVPQTGDLLAASYRLSTGDGSIAFFDEESPSGTVDGTNSQFTLSNAPNPASSLTVFRNGLLLQLGQDYTLNGQTLLFVAGAEPQTGDTLLASYRISGGAAGLMSSMVYSGPQVICSGTGAPTTSTSLSSLRTCLIPAGLLQPGDRVEIRFEMEHQGAASPFSFELHWGASVLGHRDASASDLLVMGCIDVGILNSNAQMSFQSWGSVLPFTAGVSSAADSYQSGLTVDWQGKLESPSGDRLILRSFSVVRIP